MKHGSLFSGIGGFDLAAEWMGWENKFHCENNEFCKKILKKHFSNSICYGNIIETDFSIWKGLIDVLSGGFPCQPYSQAGKRKGNKDDRHLWPEMLRAIREIQPRWVVGENVLGLLNWSKGLVFHEIQTDLEAAGYICFPYVLPACGKDAPHKRYRTWVIAYSINCGYKAGREKEDKKNGVQSICREAVDTREFNRTNISSTNPNRNGNGQHRSNGKHEINPNEAGKYALNDIEHVINTDTNNQGLQRSKVNGSIESSRKDRDEQFTGLFQPNWQEFPTQPPICGGNDGIPNRVDRIKSLGNAIVPQIALEIFKAIEQYENQNKK